jgi:hypothetical protein
MTLCGFWSQSGVLFRERERERETERERDLDSAKNQARNPWLSIPLVFVTIPNTPYRLLSMSLSNTASIMRQKLK